MELSVSTVIGLATQLFVSCVNTLPVQYTSKINIKLPDLQEIVEDEKVVGHEMRFSLTLPSNIEGHRAEFYVCMDKKVDPNPWGDVHKYYWTYAMNVYLGDTETGAADHPVQWTTVVRGDEFTIEKIKYIWEELKEFLLDQISDAVH